MNEQPQINHHNVGVATGVPVATVVHIARSDDNGLQPNTTMVRGLLALKYIVLLAATLLNFLDTNSKNRSLAGFVITTTVLGLASSLMTLGIDSGKFLCNSTTEPPIVKKIKPFQPILLFLFSLFIVIQSAIEIPQKKLSAPSGAKFLLSFVIELIGYQDVKHHKATYIKALKDFCRCPFWRQTQSSGGNIVFGTSIGNP